MGRESNLPPHNLYETNAIVHTMKLPDFESYPCLICKRDLHVDLVTLHSSSTTSSTDSSKSYDDTFEIAEVILYCTHCKIEYAKAI